MTLNEKSDAATIIWEDDKYMFLRVGRSSGFKRKSDGVILREGEPEHKTDLHYAILGLAHDYSKLKKGEHETAK